MFPRFPSRPVRKESTIKATERELRMERALRRARAILVGEAQMTRDAVQLIDNALEQ